MTTQEFINKWTLLFADTPDKNITAEKMREFTTDAGLLIIESFTNIKTIEGQSLLGIGNIDLSKTDAGLSNVDNTSDTDKPISTLTQIALNAKQATLANGTNIKTVNGNSLLGSGNLALNFIPLTGTEVGKGKRKV